MVELIYIILISLALNLYIIYNNVFSLMNRKMNDISNEEIGKDIKNFLHFQGIENVKVNEISEGFNAHCFKYGNLVILEISKDLLSSFRPNLIKSIIGHELGHIVKYHTKLSMIIKVFTMTLFLYSMYQLYLLSPYLLIVSPFIYFIKMYIDSFVYRQMEYSADKFGAQINGKDNMIVLLKKLEKYSNNKHSIFSTHPTFQERINKLNK